MEATERVYDLLRETPPEGAEFANTVFKMCSMTLKTETPCQLSLYVLLHVFLHSYSAGCRHHTLSAML